MSYRKPRDLLAGFISTYPSRAVPELVMIGEQWAPPEKRIAEHAHTVWEFYLQVSGTSRWLSAGKVRVIQPGGLLAAPPGVPHALHGRQPGDHHYLFAAIDLNRIRSQLPTSLLRVFSAGELIVKPDAGNVRPHLDALVREVSARRPWQDASLRTAALSLLIEVARTLEGSTSVPIGRHPAVHRALEQIDAAPERPWRIPHLARTCGVSAAHLSALFRAELGTSPAHHVRLRRLERARTLLTQDTLPITQIALELGFSSSQHFARVYRQHFGHSPRSERS